MNELTVQKLKDMPDAELIGKGIGTFPEIHEKEIKWVAVRGQGYYDWAIYYGLPNDSEEHIRFYGDKMFTESVIKRLVPCTEEAYKLYRG